MASRKRSFSESPPPRRGAARERGQSPKRERYSQSPVHHRGKERERCTTERDRHYVERARDKQSGFGSRHDRGRDSRHDRGGDSRHERGGDSSHDRGGDSSHDRGGDSSHDRGGDSRHDRGGDSRHDRGGDSRHDRGGDSRRDRGGDSRRDRGGDSRRDSRNSADERRSDKRYSKRDDSRQDRGDDSRSDRADISRGDNRHDRTRQSMHDKIDNMSDSSDRNHDRPESSVSRRHNRWVDGESEGQGGREAEGQEFGQPSSSSAGKAAVKEEPTFAVSGMLAADTNTYKGVVIKYSEPEEARVPKARWRLYPFKGEEALPVLYIHRQSAYLIGRDRQVADIPVDHPSCSKQHCVLQYRLVERDKEDGRVKRVIRPYLIDLESTNGTYINNQRIDPARYVELKEKDVVKFGFSSREYVLLHEQSVAAPPSPGQEETAKDNT